MILVALLQIVAALSAWQASLASGPDPRHLLHISSQENGACCPVLMRGWPLLQTPRRGYSPFLRCAPAKPHQRSRILPPDCALPGLAVVLSSKLAHCTQLLYQSDLVTRISSRGCLPLSHLLAARCSAGDLPDYSSPSSSESRCCPWALVLEQCKVF